MRLMPLLGSIFEKVHFPPYLREANKKGLFLRQAIIKDLLLDFYTIIKGPLFSISTQSD